MTEALQQVSAQRSPLHEMHLRLGATMFESDGWLIPVSYGDELFEYASVRERGVGILDLSSRGRLIVTGSEAVQFLNGLITNDMKTLEEGHWMPAAFPNVQGRLIASVRIARRRDYFLIDTEAATHAEVWKSLERFTLAGDFRVSDVTSQTVLLSVQGQNAAEIIRSQLGSTVAVIPKNGLGQTVFLENEVTVLRATHTSEDGFDLLASSNDAEGIWESLANAGARPVGHDALEKLRIEAGVPRYGVDMDATTIVTEALDDAVSYTKGCYVGQEIIARIKYRGHVAKKLMGIDFGQLVKPGKDSKIMTSDGREIGRLTSVTSSPHLGRTIALGYVKYDYISPGTEVTAVANAGAVRAQIHELPFVRGSWYRDW